MNPYLSGLHWWIPHNRGTKHINVPSLDRSENIIVLHQMTPNDNGERVNSETRLGESLLQWHVNKKLISGTRMPRTSPRMPVHKADSEWPLGDHSPGPRSSHKKTHDPNAQSLAPLLSSSSLFTQIAQGHIEHPYKQTTSTKLEKQNFIP